MVARRKALHSTPVEAYHGSPDDRAAHNSWDVVVEYRLRRRAAAFPHGREARPPPRPPRGREASRRPARPGAPAAAETPAAAAPAEKPPAAPAAEKPAAAAPASSAPTGGTVKLAAIGALTGPNGQYGQQSVDGIKFAMDDINNAGGVLG